MREIKNSGADRPWSIGGYVAPKLHTTLEPGDFTVIAGGERKQRLEQEGCCINDKVWKFHIGAPEEAGKPADLVIFAVKYHGLRQAVRDAAGYIGKDTILMSLLNGVESEEILREFYPNHIFYIRSFGSVRSRKRQDHIPGRVGRDFFRRCQKRYIV